MRGTGVLFALSNNHAEYVELYAQNKVNTINRPKMSHRANCELQMHWARQDSHGIPSLAMVCEGVPWHTITKRVSMGCHEIDTHHMDSPAQAQTHLCRVIVNRYNRCPNVIVIVNIELTESWNARNAKLKETFVSWRPR